LLRQALALAVLGGVLWLAMGAEGDWLAIGGLHRAGLLAAVVSGGLAAYFGTLFLLGFRLRDFRRRAAG
jgi:putative peptidoglycan lipid II flippase